MWSIRVTLQSEFIYCLSFHHKLAMMDILGPYSPPHPNSHEGISHEKAWKYDVMQCYRFPQPEGPAILLKRKLQVTHNFFPANVNQGSTNIKIQNIESILLHDLKSNSLIFLTIFNHLTCSLRLPADPVSPGKIF